MATATATARGSTTTTENQLLQLFLSLSTASKAITKQGGGGRRQQRQHSADGGGAFRCRTCGRCFPTFQALGGHRTSHKRPRVRAAGLDLLLGARPGKGGAAAADPDVHRCSTCGMVFATGQALGGHMRRHRAAAAVFDVAAAPDHSATTAFGDSDEDDASSCRWPMTLIKFI